MKKRTARRKAIWAYLRREANKRPYTKAPDCIIRQHNREVHKHNANMRNHRQRQINELNRRLTSLLELMKNDVTPAFLTMGQRAQMTAEELAKFEEKYQEFYDQEFYALTD